jgi:hypothetical protein
MFQDMNDHECDCYCHKDENYKHISPCCHTCPYCKRNIRFFYEDHIETCLMNKVDLILDEKGNILKHHW